MVMLDVRRGVIILGGWLDLREVGGGSRKREWFCGGEVVYKLQSVSVKKAVK
jgi:hypothetical protein